MIQDLIDQLFFGAVVQLWREYVGDPAHHLWALDVCLAAGFFRVAP